MRDGYELSAPSFFCHAIIEAMTARIGILGGTFDPIHYGHLAIAEEARLALQLDRVLFVPAAQQPLKRGRDILDLAILRIRDFGRAEGKVDRLDVDRRCGAA